MTARPIRQKFALWAAAVGGVVVLVFAAGTFFNLYYEQLEAVDLELQAAVSHLTSFDDGELADRKLESYCGSSRGWRRPFSMNKEEL